MKRLLAITLSFGLFLLAAPAMAQDAGSDKDKAPAGDKAPDKDKPAADKPAPAKDKPADAKGTFVIPIQATDVVKSIPLSLSVIDRGILAVLAILFVLMILQLSQIKAALDKKA